ncbi:hypothetical protein L1987_33002 [Smallanthus sonchifolius]|uniref:Uncharacterized protein n=1 Tax=Smallanthus sonchifolius TaxID=185202 RepID=A0ACB9HPB8_9ASTR|nr:hypothetical protein L1987_33002 [Smallanthus sonchifolius]
MTGKAKPKKHTAKEIQSKVDAATTNRGGGKAGVVDWTVVMTDEDEVRVTDLKDEKWRWIWSQLVAELDTVVIWSSW